MFPVYVTFKLSLLLYQQKEVTPASDWRPAWRNCFYIFCLSVNIIKTAVLRWKCRHTYRSVYCFRCLQYGALTVLLSHCVIVVHFCCFRLPPTLFLYVCFLFSCLLLITCVPFFPLVFYQFCFNHSWRPAGSCDCALGFAAEFNRCCRFDSKQKLALCHYRRWDDKTTLPWSRLVQVTRRHLHYETHIHTTVSLAQTLASLPSIHS